MASPLYLLDTNILVHSVRDDSIWESIQERYQLLLIEPSPIISITTSGELRSLAMQFHWGNAKLERMEFLLGYFTEIPIESQNLVRTYSMIDAYLLERGQQLGKNDLWIAATAANLQATLITTDRDFDFDDLDPLFLRRDWISTVT